MGSTGALAAVARRESTTPRIVFECPKIRAPGEVIVSRTTTLASGHCKARQKL